MQAEPTFLSLQKFSTKAESEQNVDEIVNSLYSFTFTQTTGTLLQTRLKAIKDCLNEKTHRTKEDLDELLTLIKNWESHTELSSKQLELLELTSYPYLDLVHHNRPVVRPSPMVRRATSLSVKSSEIQDLEKLSGGDKLGVPTPLEHLPSKYTNGQAIMTTNSEPPFAIHTLNDLTSLLVSSKGVKNILELVPENCWKWIIGEIRGDKRIKISGSVIEFGGKFVSLWVESINKDILVWVLEAVNVTDIKPAQSSTITGPATSFMTSQNMIYLKSANYVGKAMSLGCSIAVSSDLHILSYNKCVLGLMLGLHRTDLLNTHLTVVLPQFLEFWSFIEPFCSTPGVVLPEHYFRRLVGLKPGSDGYIAANPPQDIHHSIYATNVDGVRIPVDIQFRVVRKNYYVLWISCSHPEEVDSDSDEDSKPVKRSKSMSISDLVKMQVGALRKAKQVSDFKLVKLLGEGTYGKVELVQSLHHGVIALKSIYKDRILIDTWSRDKVLGTIPNEIKILNNLRVTPHPNIVEMIDFFEDPKCYYIEMLQMENEPILDLFDYIEQHKHSKSDLPNVQSLLLIWQQIVSAVAHIHSLGIVHRDLKDENVILNRNGDVKLIDFGSAAYLNQGPFDLFVGTVDYAAPEVLQGMPYTGEPQDTWALGILLFTIIYGEVPFRTAEEIINNKLPEEMNCLGSKIIYRILQSKPEERPSAAQILVQLNQII